MFVVLEDRVGGDPGAGPGSFTQPPGAHTGKAEPGQPGYSPVLQHPAERNVSESSSRVPRVL